jgi:SAM-dependent methyltransferase
MDTTEYWSKQHDKYALTDWIKKPSIFAEWALQYLPAHGVLIDLGAGQGQDSRFFAEKGFTVTSTDFSTTALAIAQQNSSLPIDYINVDLSNPLPFADNSFDVVYAHLSLHYFDGDITKHLFDEIHRIMKHGGILTALCNSDQDLEIQEGKPIEPAFLEVDGISKRYFSPESARAFA